MTKSETQGVPCPALQCGALLSSALVPLALWPGNPDTASGDKCSISKETSLLFTPSARLSHRLRRKQKDPLHSLSPTIPQAGEEAEKLKRQKKNKRCKRVKKDLHFFL